MKHSGYFLLALFIAGCTSSDLRGSRVRIAFQDNRQTVYELLAVRDSALLVTTGSLTPPIRSVTVPFTDIRRVYHARSSFEYGLLGAGAGFVVGLGLVLEGASIGEGGGHPNLGPAFNVLGLCTAAGAIAGVLIHGGETAYYVTSEADLNRLKEFAVERR